MSATFLVKTKPGDIHWINSKGYRVVKVQKISRGWLVELVRHV